MLSFNRLLPKIRAYCVHKGWNQPIVLALVSQGEVKEEDNETNRDERVGEKSGSNQESFALHQDNEYEQDDKIKV